MSSTDDTGAEGPLDVLEQSDDQSIVLDRAYDDQEDPSTLTVFPSEAEWPEIGTTWISVDVDHAVAIEDSR